MTPVFVTGATGYLGRPLTEALLQRGYSVHALVRPGSQGKVVRGGMPGTILRPWYVLGPGHLWPYALVPVYAILRLLPSTRDAAHRLGLVTRDQMLSALVESVANPSTTGVRIKDVPAIRRAVVPPRLSA